MKKIILFIAIISISQFSVKSETYNLDLQKSIEIAKEKSYNMLNLVQDFKIAESNLKSATSSLKTHIDLNFVAPNYSRNILEDKRANSITYYPSEELNYGGTLIINQYLPTAGKVSFETGLSNEDNYSLRTLYPKFNTTIGFEQPLTALYGYNEIKSKLKLAELDYERSKKGLKREELNIVYLVSNSFYNLLSAQKRTEIARLDFDRQKEGFEISQNKYKAGLIKEVDALQMEVDLAEAQNNFDLSIVNQGAILNEFKQLIGINLSDSVALSSEFKYEVAVVNPEKAVQLALENRLEIREQEIAIEQNQLNVKMHKSNGMIQSSLKLSFGKNGIGRDGSNDLSINSSISNSLNRTYSDFITRDPNYGIGLTVNVPILDFGENKANVKAAEAKLEQVKLKKIDVQRDIEREVRNLVANLNSSLKRLQLLEKNVKVAEKSFEITRQRYADGDVDSQGLALERNRLNNALTSHLSAYVSYQLYLADLMRKTFYDFQRNESIK
jgi:outer membrane protein TolC